MKTIQDGRGATLQPGRAADRRPDIQPQTPAPAPPRRSRGPVLIVDDDHLICQIVGEILHRDGYQTTAVQTGHAALQALERTAIRVMLVDLMLPDMEGLVLIERVLRQHPRVSAIVMTGYASVDFAVQAMKAGACDFLAKPFQPEVVRLTVDRVLELHRLRQENTVLKHALVKGGSVQVRAVQLANLTPPPSEAVAESRAAFEQGVAEGERLAQERLASGAARDQAMLAAVMGRLEQVLADIHATLEEQVASLAFTIAEKVVRTCVESHPDFIVTQVQQALNRIREGGLVQIRVHPQQVELVESAAMTFGAAASQPPRLLRIEGDPAISPGGCVIETGTLLVDARLEAQLARLGEALTRRTARETR